MPPAMYIPYFAFLAMVEIITSFPINYRYHHFNIKRLEKQWFGRIFQNFDSFMPFVDYLCPAFGRGEEGERQKIVNKS